MGLNWIELDSVTSTNDYLASLLREGKIEGETAVVSDYQESGKGQGSHEWSSEPKQNLLLSLLLFPEFLSASSQFMISKVVSVSVCKLLSPFGISPFIKWPNDIITAKGKISGILIEHGISADLITHSIIGVGVNLNQRVFPEFSPRATSLLLESGIRLEADEAGKELANLILAGVDQLKGSERGIIDRQYLERLYRIDKVTMFHTRDGSFRGILRGVNDAGELQVERSGKRSSFSHGEIRW